MPDSADPARSVPQVYSIAAHRGFADALVAGLIPRYAEPDVGLARLTLLLPSRRAERVVTEAFVRLSGQGMLLPRMAVAGDLDLDETLGPLLDPLGAGADIPPAADPTLRWLRLAAHLRDELGKDAPRGAALLRQARDVAATMDRLLVEGISPDDLMSDAVVGVVGELAGHWRASTLTFLCVQARWLSELGARGQVDAPTRRNLLFEHAARLWRESPPPHPVVAAGVTSASPALARLLRVVSELPHGAVILPDLDLSLDAAIWDELGTAGAPAGPEDPPFGRKDAVTHPQYHLKLLLNRMGVARGEVQAWHRAGLGAARSERSRAISNLFLPAEASARWAGLPSDERRLEGVRLMETPHPETEAQAISVLMREALEVPERRVALITPDRALSARVVAQLQRWGIAADDTAGQPLTLTAAGRLALLLAEVVAQDAAPVPLMALLTHPKAGAGEGRAAWLDAARRLDLALRGPRPGPGLEPLRALAEAQRIGAWWQQVEAMLAPLFALEGEPPFADLLDALVQAIEALCGPTIWANPDGRALSALIEDLREAARAAGAMLDPRELHAVLSDCMERVPVRPPWGGHPRVAIYGLLEARMSRADLVICGGLVEGVWPASPAPDTLLPPAVMRALGVPGGDFRIGLAAHDLAGALGAPQVVLSWAQRDDGAPVIPSRFVLRVKALMGQALARDHAETEAVRLARLLDDAPPAPHHPRPQPMPDATQRLVDIAATGLDRLRSDPYQFYAASILRLRRIEPLDAEPSPAWKGEAVHAILEEWHKAGNPPGGLVPIAAQVLDGMSAHPLMRALWRPRLLKALEWVDEAIVAQGRQGRAVLASEGWGDMQFRGVRVHGRADRIDRLEDGTLAIVDYKTGKPPSGKMVQQGYSLQLGLLGLIAREGGFKGVAGEPTRFEYWSLAKKDDVLGFVEEPILNERKKSGVARDEFLDVTAHFLADAIERWIAGAEPFTARLNPDLPVYNDYDHLMRLDEWLPRLSESGEDRA